MSLSRQLICSRYIAVLGFQPRLLLQPSAWLQCFHPLYRGTWFLTKHASASCTSQSRFHPLYRGTWFLIIGFILRAWLSDTFPSAISRYLVSDPTRKTPPLTSGGGNGLHTPRRIDHIPTFASLNHDKNTRSTHYTPNAGIEFSQAGFAPPHVNPVQKWA